jgi:CubicO group peptidase (beta-lactamase class C family)
MTKTHSNRTLHHYMTVLPAILMFFLVFHNPDLSARESFPEFTFNPQSEYWPTKGWKTSTPEKQGISSKILVEIFEEIENRNVDITSLLVVRNGYIVVEANRYHAETIHPIYSSTKSFVSAVFGIALSKGYVKSTDQTISDFFPELLQQNGNLTKASITLKHLLTMSCGFEWPEVQMGYSNPENPAIQMLKSSNTVQYILNKPVKQQPGQNFNYNSGCSHLLLAVLKRTGLNVADFAQENLFTPLGISKSQYIWSQDPNGIPNGGYGLNMRSRDMAKFGYLYLKGGNWKGKQLIPESWVKESTKKHIKIAWGGYIADYYGYKWYIQTFGFHSLGSMGQYIFVIPKQEIVVVFTSNLPRFQMAIPIGLVESYVIPAVKSSRPLPENEEAIATLKYKSKRFKDN